ncbi:MAG: TatD family hydrolase [Acidimicrobiia bacterium]|nr:TatD family hydrolase [Acidimicrobiia bacterium]
MHGPWVDTHCHLQLDDRPTDELLARAEPHLAWLVAPGIDAESSERSVELASRYRAVVATAGLHPHDAARWEAERERIEALIPLVSAVGETGLDFYRNLAPVEDQRRSFLDQIDLALGADLPVIVHCRDAFSDIYEILFNSPVRAILHCWTGGPRWTKRFLEIETVTFSYAGPVAFETGDTVRMGAALVPPDRCLVETDTPYLAPPPHRQEQNEPAFVRYVGAALGDVWGISVDEVAAVTANNAARVFGR